MFIKNPLTYLISADFSRVMNEAAVSLTLLNLFIFWVQVQLTFWSDVPVNVPPCPVNKTQ